MPTIAKLLWPLYNDLHFRKYKETVLIIKIDSHPCSANARVWLLAWWSPVAMLATALDGQTQGHTGGIAHREHSTATVKADRPMDAQSQLNSCWAVEYVLCTTRISRDVTDLNF